MSFFTTSDNHRIHFEDTGSGQPLLCLAGLTRNGRDFSFLAPHVTDLRLIKMDYRGRGQSDYVGDYMTYNVLRESQDVIELLDHLELPQVTVLGTSRGGLNAMVMAANHPGRLSGVILNDIGPEVSPQGIERIMEYVGKKPAARTYDEAAAAMKHAMGHEFPGVSIDIWRKQVEFQYAETPDGLDLRYDAKLHTALVEQAASGPAPDLWPLFDALKPVPVGVLRGANSDILTRETLDDMAGRHPDLIWTEVPDRGHVPFLDEPESLTLIHKILERTREHV
ncbi:alpha/beta fold hydrolase [Falsiphaeobacter marinintestinus]|uniref:alpha/beta fold hydrolase n=1 Tax=Falsiphaeobacter marinintestinus TaxID=1492905 RepID=UPI0011B76669|nr:alpha/beta hydrolase [Phaeobacter marinintestinus]